MRLARNRFHAQIEDPDMATKENAAKLSFQLKTAKGTRDWMGTDIMLRDRIFGAITEVFKRHGATALDTPVFELKEILAGKYGEDSRLIYDLADQGGELCALRYDLTVPFARWLAMNSSIQHIKRYHIAKVYRRDQPALAKGRLREFHQCDFDIAGSPWSEVKTEMEEKGLSPEVADKIGEYVKLEGGRDLVATLRSDAQLSANEDIKQGLDDLELLFNYLDALEVTHKISFNMSLARGLDYYSGLIFEVVNPLSAGAAVDPSRKQKKKKGDDEDRSDDPAVGVGSIAAGGRYDNLVNMFAPKRQIPCVGVSFGVDRIFAIMKARMDKDSKFATRPSEVDVYIMAFGGKTFNGFLLERMAIATQLWNAGIKAEFAAKVKPKLPQQFKTAEAGGVPLALILGEDELAAGKIRLKVLGLPEGHPDKEGSLVAKDDLVSEVKKLLQTL
ncbi:hypothetical protein DH86_00003200 [Scytalidium sp. 3C]|nr:hypothetical protein DH86_00003200 [Scytalidium sp. 3C]